MLFNNKKAQSTLEYAALIMVVVGALIALNAFMKRGVEGHVRNSVDDIGNQYDLETGAYRHVTEMTSAQEVTRSVLGKEGGEVTSLPGVGWALGEVSTGKGTEVQWTQTPGTRDIDEAITTDTDATIP